MGLPHQIADRLQALGHSCCATTDHGSIWSHVPLQKEFRKRGLKPLLGLEAYVVSDASEKTREQKELGVNAIPHVTLIAQSQVGYRNLIAVHNHAWQNFYYKPRTDWEFLAAHQEGLIVLSGCVGGWPSRLALQDPEKAFEWVQRWRHRFEQFYIEINPCPSMGEPSRIATETLAQISYELKIPAVVTADAHFPRPEDHAACDLMLCVGQGKRLKDERTWIMPKEQYYCSGQEMLERCVATAPSVPAWWYQEAIAFTGQIAAVCEAEVPKGKPIAFPGLEEGVSSDAELLLWIKKGLDQRQHQLHEVEGESANDTRWRYWRRAEREFNVLCKKGFADYILAVGDVCRYMKERDNLMMLRGSGGGCLILWLIGASETDPLRHDLSFERFYDETRDDAPDCDLDFEKGKRDEAIAYIYEKYGAAHCSQVAALSRIKAKAAVQDVCFALGIGREVYGPLADALNSADEDVDAQFHQVTDPRALAVLERYPQIAAMAPKLVGQYRQSSIHAAGVLVSSEPLDQVVGVILGAEKQPVATVDKRGAKEIGLLKMDFLSVKGLDVVAGIVRNLGESMEWLYGLPLDDEQALATAKQGRLAGIFQLDGAAALRVARQIGLDSFDDLVAASGLCRPGPAEWVTTYAENKAAPEDLMDYLSQMHPVAARILAPTYGILCYQEQVMALARDLAGLDWPLVHRLRGEVQDKVGLDPQKGPAWREEWQRLWGEGCARQGVSEAQAKFWWHSVESHGSYGFNRSHCTTYGLISYWMLYLKAHYPAEFYEVYLQLDEDQVTMKRLIAEWQASRGDVFLIDPTVSAARFSSPFRGALVGGYENIAGIGRAVSEKIMAKAPFADWDDLLARGLPKGLAAKIGAAQDERGWKPQETIQLAPWFPVQRLGDEEAWAREHYGLAHLGDFPEEPLSGDVTCCGYVTVTNFRGEKIIFVLEDEHRPIVVRVSRRHAGTSEGQKFRDLKVGDFIAVTGWWAGSNLFAKQFAVVKPSLGKKKRNDK